MPLRSKPLVRSKIFPLESIRRLYIESSIKIDIVTANIQKGVFNEHTYSQKNSMLATTCTQKYIYWHSFFSYQTPPF